MIEITVCTMVHHIWSMQGMMCLQYCHWRHSARLLHWVNNTCKKMGNIFQTTWMKTFVLWFRFQWRWCWSAIWLRKLLGAKNAISNYLNQWWPSSKSHVCATWPQWLNGIIWWASQLYFCNYTWHGSEHFYVADLSTITNDFKCQQHIRAWWLILLFQAMAAGCLAPC